MCCVFYKTIPIQPACETATHRSTKNKKEKKKKASCVSMLCLCCVYCTYRYGCRGGGGFVPCFLFLFLVFVSCTKKS